uniref:ATP synthase F0 subunit 8 n=1 Tax=Nisia fuliginosa TaxID=2743077 RepID=A0A8A4JFJ0_9HEMI|nr:ATP synthase F0 subunit 8 [Nisia fuliginosa]
MPQMSNMPWMSMFMFMSIMLLTMESNMHFQKKKKW